MSFDFDSFINDIINDVKGLFGSRQRYNPTRAPQASTPPSQKPEASAGGFVAPIHDSWMTSGTFSRSATDSNHPNGHFGVDMGCPEGTPVYAFGPGIVTKVGVDGNVDGVGGGNTVWIKHREDLYTYYAHMSTVKAQVGDKVDTNTVIGTVGNTGNARRGWPHLHFTVATAQSYSSGAVIDPARYMAVPPYNPDYGHNPQKYQARWTNDQAREEAQAFNMRDHLQERRVAFSRDVEKLMVLAHKFEKLTR